MLFSLNVHDASVSDHTTFTFLFFASVKPCASLSGSLSLVLLDEA